MFSRSELERLTVAGLKNVAAQQKLETRGVRAELLDRLADHFERRGWPARSLGEVEMSEETMEIATTEAVEGQTNRNILNRSDAEPILECAPPGAEGGRRLALDAVQMQTVVQAVLRALEVREGPVQGGAQPRARASESVREQENMLLAEQNSNLATVSTGSSQAVANNWSQIKYITKLIPPFSGKDEENILNWLDRVTYVARVYNITDEVLLLAAIGQLRGRAADWYNRQPLRTISSWDEFKFQVRNYFERKESYAMTHSRISSRVWKSHSERFVEYAEDKLRLMQLLTLTEREQIELLADGVRDPHLRRLVLTTWAQTVPEFIEQVRRMTDDEVGNRDGRRGRVDGRLLMAGDGVCYNCKRPGHMAKDCRVPRLSCFNCGHRGHKSSACPRRNGNQGTTLHHIHQEQNRQRPSSPEQSVLSVSQLAIKMPTGLSNQDNFCINVRAVNSDSVRLRALLDTGSSVNLVRHSVYLQSFVNAELCKINNNIVLKGVNDSKIIVFGEIQTQIHIDQLPNAVFNIALLVVADDTMIYDVIIGREFLDNSKLRLIYSNGKASLEYIEQNVMTIESILPIYTVEIKDKYDIILEKLDSSLPWNFRQDLLSLLREIDNAEIQSLKEEYYVRVHLKDNSLFRYAPRRMSFAEKAQLEDITNDLLTRGIIKPSISPYCARVVLVNKQNGQKRMCVDLRPLNQRISAQKYPFPIIEDQIDQLHGKRVFTKLDLKDGFHQIDIHPDDTKYFAFATHKGQYEFVKLPFGYSEAPAEFQKRILYALRSLIQNNKVLVYIDDILIATETFEENLHILKETLILLSQYNLELNLSKCLFLKTEIEYLGYLVSGGGITMSKRHVEAIINFPEPKNVKEIQSFLGLTNYFRKFIRDYALKSKSLQDLVKKNVEFVFSDQCKKSFEILKQELSSPPVLHIYNPKAETELHTDASSLGFGAILLQKQENGALAPIAYFSKSTNEAEKRYHSYELETLAIVKAVERFHVYLQGINFRIVTDCNSLVLAFKKININPRIARWSLSLQNYHFEIVHRSGNKMQHVDCLSRNILFVNTITVEDELMYKQLMDAKIKEIAENIETKGSDHFTLIDGLVFRMYKEKPLFVVPENMISNIIRIYHDEAGHVGLDKTMHSILTHYWFPCMKLKIKEHIENCVKCLSYSVLLGKMEGEMQIFEKETSPFKTLHIDHFGPLEATSKGYKYILVIVDAYTKFVWLFPTKSTGTDEAVTALKSLFAMFGYPQCIISDRSTAFSSAAFTNYMKNNEIKHIMTAVASPWANGQVERVNRFLKSTLSKINDQENNWKENLNKVQYVINNTFNKSIGSSPSKMFLGYEQRHGVDSHLRSLINKLRDQPEDCEQERNEIRNQAQIVNRTLREYNKQQYDKHHKKCTLYKPGDLVLIKVLHFKPGTNKKLAPKFKGPYQIKAVLNNNRYVVTDIPGYNITQKPLNTIMSSDKLKPWIRLPESEKDKSESKLSNFINDSETQ